MNLNTEEMINNYKLHIGDYSDNGQITIVDEDRLCYLVQSASRGASGLRTISKALLKEFVDFVQAHPAASPRDCRDALSGVSGIDKYEYGYDSTLLLMAKMILGKESIKHKTFKKVLLHNDSTTLFVWDCIKLFNEKNELKELLESQWTETIDGNVADYITVNGCYVARCGDSDQYQSIKIYDGRILNCGFDARNIRAFAETINQIYSGRYRIEIENNLNDDEIYNLIELSSFDGSKYLPYLTALRTKPFMLLAGISGTGKSRIVRKLAQATNTKEYANEEDRWKDNRPDNFQLIQVKPNWHNSMDVAGFLSNIPTPHYVFTDFVCFIVKAWQHPETPYFLCLDEMNLAPVEEYFAEFLSAIESRAWDENGHYTTDPIISPFKDFGKEVCEAMLKELLGEARHTEANPLAIQFEEKGLTLPPNLMVMGTVNMDETTFSFSRKVLDRAMSVEMNEVKYDDFLEGKTELMPLLTEWNEKLVNRPQKAQEVQGEIDSQKVIDYLKAVNELLDSTPFKLGYRAANEAILYVSACQDFAKDDFTIEKALDEFTLMKILSRIEGDDSRLAIDEKDERLQAAGIDGNAMDDGEQSLNLLNCLRAIVRQHIGQDTETEKKINRMYNTLLREHFVSYWG